MPIHPTAFISYSWDNEPHKAWVAKLGAELRADGIDVHLDQWHTVPGDQLPHFMEKEIRDNDFVIVLCTPDYKRKSDSRAGGVGYEGDIMTAEVFTNKNHRKFIPVLVKGSWLEAAPSWLKGRYFIDLSKPSTREAQYQDLLTTIHGDRPQAPPLGVRTLANRALSRVEADTAPVDEPTRILGIIVDEVTEPSRDGSPGSAMYSIPFRLSRKPSIDWEQFFYHAWKFPRTFSSMHRSDIAHVTGNRIILAGTTIEEVQQYHKATLQLCVSVANEKEAELISRISQERSLQKRHTDEHRKKVSDVASQIRFDA